VQSDPALAQLLSEQTSPFDRLEWWQMLERHCGLEPRIASARDGAAYAVLALTPGRKARSLANWYTFRFRPVVSASANGRVLLSTIARVLRRKSARITLAGVPEEDARLLKAAFADAGWAAYRSATDVNHFLLLEGRDFESYLAGRPGPLRSTLERKSGKVATRIVSHFDPAAWDQYESVYRDSWKPEEGSPAFLRAFAEAEGAAGRLRLGLAETGGAETGGEIVAAQFWTVDHGTAYIHKLAYRESAKGLSPGTVLTAALLRHVIDTDRVARVDFGTGDDAYKRDWMERMRSLYRLDLLRRDVPANWPFILRKRLQALAAGAKRR